jgi:hypothetical protein
MTRSKRTYPCPCGKNHRSRNTVWLHKKAIAAGEKAESANTSLEKGVSGVLGTPVKNPFMAAGKAGQKAGASINKRLTGGKPSQRTDPKTPDTSNLSERVHKISLKGEFDKMAETMGKPNPKGKDEAGSQEPNYECAYCGEKFYMDKRPKACPFCGGKY